MCIECWLKFIYKIMTDIPWISVSMCKILNFSNMLSKFVQLFITNFILLNLFCAQFSLKKLCRVSYRNLSHIPLYHGPTHKFYTVKFYLKILINDKFKVYPKSKHSYLDFDLKDFLFSITVWRYNSNST